MADPLALLEAREFNESGQSKARATRPRGWSRQPVKEINRFIKKKSYYFISSRCRITKSAFFAGNFDSHTIRQLARRPCVKEEDKPGLQGKPLEAAIGQIFAPIVADRT